MTAAPVASVADQVRVAIEATNSARMQVVDPRILQTLCIVPEWTDRLASIVLRLDDHETDALVRQLEANALANVERAAGSHDDPLLTPMVIGMLGSLAPARAVASALEAASSIGDLQTRSEALAALGPALTDDLVPLARAAATEIPDLDRARVLATFIDRVAPAERSVVAEQIAREAEQARPLQRATLVVASAPYLPSERRNAVVGSAIDAALTARSDSSRASVLTSLASALPDDLLAVMASAVASLADPRARALVLAALASTAPEIVTQLADAAPRLEDDAANVSALAVSAEAHARQGDLARATRDADLIDDADTRGRLLASLLVALPASTTRTDAVALAAHAAASVADNADAATRVAVQSQAALTMVRFADPAAARSLVTSTDVDRTAVGSTVRGVGPLTSLAEAAIASGDRERGAEVAAAALRLLQSVDDPRTRALGIGRVIPYLGSADVAGAQNAVIAALDSLTDPVARASLLVALATSVDRSILSSSVDRTIELARSPRPIATFWMADDVRTEVLNAAIQRSGIRELLRRTAELSREIEQAVADGVPGAPLLASWLPLANRVETVTGVADAAQWLTLEVDRAIRAEDLATAHTIAATGAALARVVGEPLTTAARQVDRKLALVHRRENDQRHLVAFLPRADQVSAIDRLLDGPDEHWALHFLGVGGVGKTMLLRYLTGNIADARDLVTARVDFDYLTPDYPARRPAELLLALASDLEAYVATPSAEEKVRQLQDEAVAFHSRLGKDELDGDPLKALGRPEFRLIIGIFTELLRLLTVPANALPTSRRSGPASRRPVLILDTCEELTKLQPSGTSHPSVIATFAILEMIHAELPSLRVIFSGRRLLTQSGAGWQASDERAGGTSPLLPAEKPYLDLQLLRGFDLDEARTYLHSRRGIDLPPDVEQELFDISPDAQPAIEIRWSDPSHLPGPDAHDAQRVSPFDLAVHAEFAHELRPGGGNAALLQDIYVERRIIGRIRPRRETDEHHQQVASDVRALLPAAVLFGRFDRAMLQAARLLSPDRFEAAFQELASQEWIEVQRDASLELTFLTVDHNLLPRLRRYFATPPRLAETDRISDELGPEIADMIDRTSDVATIPVELMDAALRFLHGPAASSCWDAYLHRCLSAGRIDRCSAVASAALVEGGSVGPDGTHPLTAAIRATFVASLVQERSEADRDTQWAAIQGAAEREPDPGVKRWLQQRAVAFRISNGDAAALEAAARTIETELYAIRRYDSPFAARRARELAASYIAAFEAIVERSEAQGQPIASKALDRCMAVVSKEATPRMRAFIASLQARIEAGNGAYDDAESRMESAVQLAQKVAPADGPSLDWRAPDDLADRLRLEEARLLTRVIGHTPRRKRPAERLDLPESIESIDAERLASAVLADRLSRGLVPVTVLEKLAARDVYDPDRVAHCNAHRWTPHLAITLADGFLATGDAPRALATLEQRRAAAFDSGRDTATTEAMDFAKVDVARRMRLAQGVVESLVDRFAASTTVEVAGRALEAAALTRGGSLPSAPTLMDVAPERWWRVQATLRPDVGSAIDPESIPGPVKGGPLIQRAPAVNWSAASFVEVSRSLDDIERARILGTAAWSPLLAATAWGRAHPTRALEGARIAARMYMLEIGSPTDPEPATAEAGRIAELRAWERVLGRRRLAIVTLEEAELLALRLPAAAARGFKQAARLFRDTEDPVGQFMASTGMALALRHAGKDEERRTTAAHLQETYGQLLRKRATDHLPTWAEIKNAAGRSIRGPLARLADDPWRPWVERLYVATAWAMGKPGRRRAAPVEGTQTSLPTELLDLATAPSSRSRSIAFYLSIALSVVILAAFFYLILTIATPLPFEIRLIAAAVGSPVFFVIAAFRGSSGEAVRRVTQLRLAITPGAPGAEPQLGLVAEVPITAPDDDEQDPTGVRRILLIAARVYLRSGGVMVMKPAGAPNEGQATAIDAKDPDDVTYQERTSRIPGDIVMELRQRAIDAIDGPVALPLTVDRTVSGEPWEAMLALAGSPPDGTSGHRSLVPYRTADSRPGPRRGGRRTNVRVFADADLRTATSPWFTTRPMAVAAQNTPPTSWGDTADIFHFIGRPVQGDGEIVLDIGGLDDRVPPQSLGSAATGSGRSGTTVRLATLDLQKVALVVIQARPDDPARRAASDRRKASRLRALAADALAAGAETVVIVPSLPGPLADLVITSLARRLGPMTFRARIAEQARRLYVSQRGAPTYRQVDLVAWLAEARNLVEAWPLSSSSHDQPADDEIVDAYVELAFDMTICTRPAPRHKAQGEPVKA